MKKKIKNVFLKHKGIRRSIQESLLLNIVIPKKREKRKTEEINI